MTAAVREGTVRANGIEFAYLELGSGPLVLLLHGFPDNAYTWEHQMPVLAEAGFRAVAPYLRGYPPSEIPPGGFYDAATLALDARELIRELNGGEPAFLVGTDWGTQISYATLQAFPESVRRAAVLAVPLQAAAAEIMTMPALIQYTFHVWFFQVPFFPEVAVPANDFGFIDFLWRLWEPGFDDPVHLARVKRTLGSEGALEAALAYYRATFDPARADPALDDVRGRLGTRIRVPTMAIFGRDDPLAVFADRHAPFFDDLRVELVEGSQHFVHRSRPDAINELLVSWLGASSA